MPTIVAIHTDKQDQSFRRWLGGFYTELAHATNDGAYKVNVENGKDINQVENDGNGQKA